MQEYIVHIFDVTDNGCIIGETEKIYKIFAENDDIAYNEAILMKQKIDKIEPLSNNEKWCMHLLKDDEVII